MNYSLACFSSYQRIRAVEITRSQFHSRCSALNCTCKIGCLDKYDEPRERGSCSCQGRAQGSLHCGEGGEPGVETVTPALVRLQTSRGARGLPARGLTAQPQQLNDLLPLVSPPSPRALGHMASGQGWLQCKGMGLRPPAQPDLYPSHSRSWVLYGKASSCSMVRRSCSHLGVLSLPSTQRWELASAGAFCTLASAWQFCCPLLPVPPLHWDSTFGAAYLCFQCAGLAKLCMFLVCLLFQSCSPPAVVAGTSAGSRTHSDHRGGPC